MAIDRRNLLRGLTGAAVAALVPSRPQARGGGHLYLSARADAVGGYRASGFRAGGATVFDLPLPARGHSFAIRPGRREAVSFARRPGRFALVIDIVRGTTVNRFAAPADRHFYGHGVFGPDGRLIYTSENDFDGERGVIGVYDAENSYARIGELPSHGIGPHDIRLLSDGRTLVVANGGILTRPDLPRVKLNLPTMLPSLCLVDRFDGGLVREYRLAPHLNQLSIRHLAVGEGDMVAVAMQYEGPAGDLVPLAALYRDGGLLPLAASPGVWRAMKRYCGSVCFDEDGRTIAVSAPRGNLVAFWDGGSGAYLSTARLTDGCGLAPGARPGEFLASGGAGDVAAIDARSGAVIPLAVAISEGARWDNHLAAARITRIAPD